MTTDFDNLQIQSRSILELKPIGIVRSCYPDKFGTPRQSGLVPESRGVLEFFPEVQPEESLQGLEGFSHLWVLFWFHQNKASRFHAKVHPPRLGGESRGVFATRSPHRPNPIGLSVLKILKINKDTVEIQGLDLVDGTPILDIKPYLPDSEAISDATRGWNAKPYDVQINWSEVSLLKLSKWIDQAQRPELKVLIENTLKLDPRPQVYKGFEDKKNESPYRTDHAVRIYDGDIHFRFVNKNLIQIFDIIIEGDYGF